jgi:hypothetical protein
MKVGEIFVALGFQADTKSLNQFDDGIKNLSRDILALTGISSLSVYGMKQLIDTSVAGAAAFKQFTTQTGLSVKELQQWQSIAAQTDLNLKPEAVQGGIMAMQRNLTQLQKFGTGDVQAFNFLGLDYSQDALKNLERLRHTIGQFDRPTAVNLLERIGLSGDWLNVLTLSEEKFSKFKNNFILSDQEIAQTQKAGIAIQTLGRTLAFARDQFVSDHADGIQSFAKQMGEAFTQLNYIIKNFDINKIGNIKFVIAGLVSLIAAATAPITSLAAALVYLGYQFDKFLGDGERWGNFKKSVKDFFSGETGRNLPGAWGDKSYNEQRRAGGGVMNNTTNNFKIDVHGAEDPGMLSKGLMQSWETALKQRNNGPAN